MISANTLFHFTGKLENLISILTNEFRPRFCLEDFTLVFAGRNPPALLELAVPMVCFCDLPLSQTHSHLSAYGDYGIGMTKSWGQKNGITPVLYLHNKSLLAFNVAKLLEQLRDGRLPADHQGEFSKGLYDLACYIKPYEGTFSRDGTQIENYRFYNEREWRYVQVMPDDFHRTGMIKIDFLNDETRQAANERLAELARISFEPNDIKYLIVRREDEIVPFITEVKRIKGKYSHNDVELVASRVISAEQIRSDF